MRRTATCWVSDRCSQIVYRDTTEPTWSHTIKVGNVRTFTVEGITKDNFLFGVGPSTATATAASSTFPRP
jgi:hypothetical protein